MPGWRVDPYGAKFEDGWVWGIGAHDDKGGLVAAISAVEAIDQVRHASQGRRARAPVIAHKFGGAGTHALLSSGVRADLCINMENSNNTIATVCVGIVMVRIPLRRPICFSATAPKPSRNTGAIEQHCHSEPPRPEPHDRFRRWLAGSIRAGSRPPGLPDPPYDIFHKRALLLQELHRPLHSSRPNALQFRTVPGQTHSLDRDPTWRCLEGSSVIIPPSTARIEIPARGTETAWTRQPWNVRRDHRAGEGAGRGQERWPPAAGLGRCPGPLGNVGDGKSSAVLGIPTVQYGRAGVTRHLQGMADRRRARTALASW